MAGPHLGNIRMVNQQKKYAWFSRIWQQGFCWHFLCIWTEIENPLDTAFSACAENVVRDYLTLACVLQGILRRKTGPYLSKITLSKSQ